VALFGSLVRQVARVFVLAVGVGAAGCAASARSPAGAATAGGEVVGVALPSGAPIGSRPGHGPPVERIDPFSGGMAERPAGLVALAEELRRAMTELGAKADPAPYFIAYEATDRDETFV